jgi:membrane protein implicated in regulation of membrane protease activity
VLLIAGAATLAGALYYLYQRQLGAISFFILSIFFFYLAYAQLSKGKKAGWQTAIKRSEKRGENDR